MSSVDGDCIPVVFDVIVRAASGKHTVVGNIGLILTSWVPERTLIASTSAHLPLASFPGYL